ncbi:ISPg3 transposase [Porphyromonas gingivalis]|nr:ISPg3 transposase [Porphyromonas gingivalis]
MRLPWEDYTKTDHNGIWFHPEQPAEESPERTLSTDTFALSGCIRRQQKRKKRSAEECFAFGDDSIHRAIPRISRQFLQKTVGERDTYKPSLSRR